MSQYYKPRKTYNLFVPGSTAPFRLSRSKIDLFMECRRCFYLDRRVGVGRPPGFPFNLNSAVDTLLKKEFDAYREKQEPHPLMTENGIKAVPFRHERMEEWRDALKRGVSYTHEPTRFTVTGGVDDVWAGPGGELIVVDYKSTSKAAGVSIDADWQIGYKRQLEVYQWLFRRNGFKVSPTGYFVYCNGLTTPERFDARLEFEIKVIPYEGDDAWIEPTLVEARRCLESPDIPDAGEDCDYCRYVDAVIETRLPGR